MLALGAGAVFGSSARAVHDLTFTRQRPLRSRADRILDHPASECPIDTVVIVMLENRSFDHFLGWLASDEVYLEQGRRRFGAGFHVAGSVHGHYRTPNGTETATENAVEILGSHTNAFRGCTYQDPGHTWQQGRAQRDEGFLSIGSGNDEFAVTYFDGEALPHHRRIAEHFTIADHHYSSLLGPTFPNRMYLHAAQSEGRRGDPGPLKHGIYHSTTIWDMLGQSGVPATYYYTDIPLLLLWGERMARYVAPIDRYFEQAGAGALPNVVMIDPSFTGELRADAHPRGDVGVAAGFVAVVLEALMRSPQWQRSLFVITHDEWGGFFDTLPPITLPDDRASRVDDKNFGQAGFRVPAAHISRYTPGNAVDHTVYDHTSILRFIEWRFLGAPVAGPGPGSTGRWWLTTRDRHAHPVGQLLRTTPAHDDVPSPLIPPDDIPHRVRECVEDVGAERRPFDVTPEFADLLALLHRPAQNRPWEELVRRS